MNNITEQYTALAAKALKQIVETVNVIAEKAGFTTRATAKDFWVMIAGSSVAALQDARVKPGDIDVFFGLKYNVLEELARMQPSGKPHIGTKRLAVRDSIECSGGDYSPLIGKMPITLEAVNGLEVQVLFSMDFSPEEMLCQFDIPQHRAGLVFQGDWLRPIDWTSDSWLDWHAVICRESPEHAGHVREARNATTEARIRRGVDAGYPVDPEMLELLAELESPEYGRWSRIVYLFPEGGACAGNGKSVGRCNGDNAGWDDWYESTPKYQACVQAEAAELEAAELEAAELEAEKAELEAAEELEETESKIRFQAQWASYATNMWQ